MSIHSLEDQLWRDEGEVLHEYKDHLGYSTIGIGRLIDSRKGGGISHEEAIYLLKNDIKEKSAEVLRELPWVAHKLSPTRQAVLFNMAFQMGIDGLLDFKNTLHLIETGQYVKAAAAMLQSKWAEQTPARAHRLANQMATDTWQ